MAEFLRQVGIDNVVEAVLCQGLLLGAHSHLEQLLDGMGVL